MTCIPDQDLEMFLALSRAVVEYCDWKFQNLLREIITRMRGLSAVGIFGGDETFWEECCRLTNIQNLYAAFYEDGDAHRFGKWDLLLNHLVDEVLADLSHHELRLMTYSKDCSEGGLTDGEIAPRYDAVKRCFVKAVSDEA